MVAVTSRVGTETQLVSVAVLVVRHLLASVSSNSDPSSAYDNSLLDGDSLWAG